MLGALLMGYLSDKLGKRAALFLGYLCGASAGFTFILNRLYWIDIAVAAVLYGISMGTTLAVK